MKFSIGKAGSRMARAFDVIKRCCSRRPGLLVLGIGVVLVVIGLVVWRLSAQNAPTNSSKKSAGTVVSAEDAVKNTHSLIEQVDTQKSSVCNTVSQQNIQTAIDEPGVDAKAMFADTETKEGTVASCSYTVDVSKSKSIRSVVILKRVFKEVKEANKAFDIASKDRDKNVSGTNGQQAFYSSGDRQLTILDESTIYTISINVKDKDADTKESLVKIAKLVNN